MFTPSMTGGPPTRPSDQGGNQGGGNQFASSAASNLYLYTFLATLVLLLLVSGAVIVRSIMIRVRARRAIEESIRNGTYVPPPPRPGSTNAPKPVFYDAHLKEKDMDVLTDEKNGKWDGVVPVAAVFVPSTSQPTLPRPATSPQSTTRTNRTASRFRILNPFRTVYLQDILDELASRDLHARMALQQPQQPSQAELAAAAFDAPPPPPPPSSGDGGNTEQPEIDPPSAVRVAVLIAMPDPAHPTNINLQHDETRSQSSAASGSTSSSNKGKTPASSESETETTTPKPDEEPEIPYVEFGIADVPLSTPAKSVLSSPSSSSSQVQSTGTD